MFGLSTKMRIGAFILLSALVMSIGYVVPAHATSFGSIKSRLVIEGAPLLMGPGGGNAVLFQGRVFVPIRVLEEALGVSIGWDDATVTVLLNSEISKVTDPLRVGPKVGNNQSVNVVINNRLFRTSPAAVLYEGFTYVPVRVVEELGYSVGWDADNKVAYIGEYDPEALPVVGTLSNLEALLSGSGGFYPGLIRDGAVAMPEAPPAPAPSAPQESTGDNSAKGDSYSQTNTQVAGVDESDIVKTDGKYIYQVRGNVVTIFEAYPADQLKVVTSLTFTDEGFMPNELYLDGDHLVVIGRSQLLVPESEFDPETDIKVYPIGETTTGVNPDAPTGAPTPADPPPAVDLPAADGGKSVDPVAPTEPVPTPPDSKPPVEPGADEPIDVMPPDAPSMMPRWPGYWYNGTTKVVIFDISDMSNVTKIREVEVDGDYLTSRKIDGRLFIIANRYPNWWGPIILPQVRDSVVGEDFVTIDPADIRYFPGQNAGSYLLIGSLDLNDDSTGTVVEAFLGAGDNIYMSLDNLYVAVPSYTSETYGTTVYRFGIEGTEVTYAAKGTVPGNVLNQFSMDQHAGHFRIATTSWGRDRTANNLYVLDMSMNTVGRIEDIAPGERIFSARFMGDKGYMVTFEMIDPLFVIDLSVPTNPRILGELKIPGFSNYLHPLDDNHLLGIGRDTDVEQRRDHLGNVVGEFVIEKGIKLAIFDVRDVNNPIEKHVAILGARGSYAEVLNNHKALLYDEERGIMAFAASLYAETPEMSWGMFNYQGAFFFEVGLQTGFRELGRVTHITADEYGKVQEYWYAYDAEVRRVLFIEDHYYVISNRMITAHQATGLHEVARVEAK